VGEIPPLLSNVFKLQTSAQFRTQQVMFFTYRWVGRWLFS